MATSLYFSQIVSQIPDSDLRRFCEAIGSEIDKIQDHSLQSIDFAISFFKESVFQGKYGEEYLNRLDMLAKPLALKLKTHCGGRFKSQSELLNHFTIGNCTKFVLSIFDAIVSQNSG